MYEIGFIKKNVMPIGGDVVSIDSCITTATMK